MSKKPNKKVTTTVTTTTTTVEEIVDNKIVETHYLLILDESGSMSGVRDVTISGFNEQIQTIKSLEKEFPDQKYFVSLITFNSTVRETFMDRPASEVKEITHEDYKPNNNTALLDAIGLGITRLEDKIAPSLNDATKIVTAVVVIMTDGHENYSQKWSSASVKETIERVKKNDKFTVNFVGANQDAVLMGHSLGVDRSNSMNYASTVKGTNSLGRALSASLHSRAKSIHTQDLSFVGGTMDAGATYFSAVVADGSNTIDEDLIDKVKLKAEELKKADKLKNDSDVKSA